MKAILKRELRSCFYAPTGYVCVAAIAALYGFFYYQVMMTGSSSYVSAVYSMLFSFDMMLIPILTMRSMAEEKRNHTDQALLTAPVAVVSIVTGKFLACFFVFTIASLLGLLPAVVMSGFAAPPWGLILGNFVGTLSYGGAMIAIGIFISSLTVSQVVAAVATFAVSMFLVYMDFITSAISNPFLASLISGLSFYARYAELTRGRFSVPAIVYFIGIVVFFLYLTTIKTESERSGKWQWRSLLAGKAVIVFAVIVASNLLASALVNRFPSWNPDMTVQKLNTLSEEAKDAVTKIDRKVEVYILAKESEARTDKLFAEYGIQYSQVVNLLEQMQEQNPKIRVEFKNPSANPALLAAYEKENLTAGDILIVSDLRYRVLGAADLFVQQQDTATGSYAFYSQADSALANGIAYAAMADVPLITAATGHGEMLDASARSAFDTLMENNAFAVGEINFLTEDIPADTSVLFLPAPTTDYTEEEIKRLRAFLLDDTDEKAHTVLFAAYPTQGTMPNLEGFLEEWGISVGEGTVFETEESRMFLTSPNTIFVKSSNQILTGETYDYLLAPVSSPLEILFDSNDGIHVFPLWTTADTTYVQTKEEIRKPETAEHVTAAYAYREIGVNGQTAWRNLIVMGSSMALASPYVNSDTFGNQAYVRDLMRLASNTKAYTAVMPKRTALGTTDIVASKMTINVVGIGIFTVTLPLCILGIGIFISRKRRSL